MLDVHPPHQAAHTWKDFFIHIATIVIGLLIAIGLEQTVEFFHHREQVAVARESLRIEHEQNRRRFQIELRAFEQQKANVEANLVTLVYLRQHPHATPAQLPHRVVWHIIGTVLNDAAWQTVQRSNITSLIPPEEVTRLALLYREQDVLNARETSLGQAMSLARRYTFEDAEVTHLTPAQVKEEIDLTKSTLLALYGLGTSMRNLNLDFPDFSPAPSSRELLSMMHETNIDEGIRIINTITEQNHRADALEDTLPATPDQPEPPQPDTTRKP